MKNEKALKVSKLAGEGTVVTVLNAISEQDAQASIKAGVHLNKLTEERSKRLEKTRKALEDYGIDYDQIIVRGNAKELLKHANSGKYEIVVLSNRKAEDKKKFVLGSVSHKVAKRATIPVLIVK